MTTRKRTAGSEGIRQRGPNSWEVRYETPRIGGKRKTETVTVRGTLKDAQRERRRLLSTIDKGVHVDPNKIMITDYVADRIDIWHGSGQIGNRTAERYRYTNETYFVPHLGNIQLQKLSTIDMEQWHVALRRRGLDPRNIR